VKKLTFTPACAATIAAFYTKGSNAQIATFAKPETVAFLLDVIGPYPASKRGFRTIAHVAAR
jgi:hypothetical protein